MQRVQAPPPSYYSQTSRPVGIYKPDSNIASQKSSIDPSIQTDRSGSSTMMTPLGMTSLSDEQAALAVEQFGSPYATNANWRPTRAFELRLTKLPKLGIGLRIKQRFARSAGDIWNPPCPSFQRSLPTNIDLCAFEPVSCKGGGEFASDGFDAVYPGTIMGPRDVSAADWYRFLQDLEVSGRLSGGQEIIAGVAPITMHMGATGYFVTKAIKNGMARRKEPMVYETVEQWNHYFFSKRGLDVYLRKNDSRLTATTVGGQVALIAGTNSLLSYNGYPNGSDREFDRGYGKKEKRNKDKKKDKKKAMFLIIAPARRVS